MASIAQLNSNSERYFAALAVAERRAHSDASPWMRATTTRFRHTLQRALSIPCMGQWQTSSDRRIGAGAGNGSCPFFCSQGRGLAISQYESWTNNHPPPDPIKARLLGITVH